MLGEAWIRCFQWKETHRRRYWVVLKREQTPSNRSGPGMGGLESAQGLCFDFVVVFPECSQPLESNPCGVPQLRFGVSLKVQLSCALMTRLRRSWSHWQ